MMNDQQNRRREMFVRVQDFNLEHPGDFPPASVTAQLFTTLGSVITELDDNAAAKSSSDGTARQGTTTRSQAREALRDDLEAINRTARAMSDHVPGLDDKFRLPRGNNDQNLLSAARAFADDATPLSAQFIAHELPADFLDDLNADIATFETSISSQSSGLGQRVAAGAAIDDLVEQGNAAVRKLDALVKNKYTNNPAVLAQWTSASHTERGPHHSAPQTPPAQPPAPPTP